MRYCLIFLLYVITLVTSLPTIGDDNTRIASRMLIKGVSKTNSGKKIKNRAEKVLSKSLNISKRTAVVAGGIAVGLTQKKISTDNLNIKHRITPNIIVNPILDHRLDNNSTLGSVQLNISF